MTDWIKSICSMPFSYGMKQLNQLAMSGITMFFNTYGNKFFETDEKVIANQFSTDSTDTFVLYPIDIVSELKQNVASNILRIYSGHIEPITIDIPWKNIASTSVTVHSDRAELSVDISAGNLAETILSLSNSIIYQSTSADSDDSESNNRDLIDVYDQVNAIVSKYFKSIRFELKSALIRINSIIVIEAHNIIYHNNIITIDSITVKLDMDNITTQKVFIQSFTFDLENNKLTIDKIGIDVDSTLLSALPNISVKQSDDKQDISLTINVAEIFVEGIPIKIETIAVRTQGDLLTIEKLDKCAINNSDIVYTTKKYTTHILRIDQTDLSYLLESEMHICIRDIVCMGPLQSAILNCTQILQSKIQMDQRHLELIPQPNVSCGIGSKIAIEYNKRTFDISVGSIIPSYISDIRLTDTTSNITYHIEQIVLEEMSCGITKLSIANKQDSIFIEYVGLKYLSDSNELTIYKGSISDGQFLIDYLQNMSMFVARKTDESLFHSIHQSMLGSVQEEKSDKHFVLIIHDTHITHTLAKTKVLISIDCGTIYPLDKILLKTYVKLYVDDYYLGDVNITQIDSSFVKIEQINSYLTPEIFDQLNEIIGTLRPVTPQQAKRTANIIKKSMLAQTQSEFRSILQEVADDEHTGIWDTAPDLTKPTINILVNSIRDLNSIFVDNYDIADKYDLHIQIDNVQVFLTDEDKFFFNSEPFMCVNLAGISFSKEILIKDPSNLYPKTKYAFRISQAYILDLQSTSTEWKYFMRQTYNDYFMDVQVLTSDDIWNIKSDLRSLTLNIKEDILIRLLGFISNSYTAPRIDSQSPPSSFYIELFDINEIILTINFIPAIFKEESLGSQMITLKDFKLKLSRQYLKNVDGLHTLGQLLSDHYKADVRPTNILQFIPNLQMMKPCVVAYGSFGHLYGLLEKYFSHKQNKIIIRALTKRVNKGVSFIRALFLSGFNRFGDIFL